MAVRSCKYYFPRMNVQKLSILKLSVMKKYDTLKNFLSYYVINVSVTRNLLCMITSHIQKVIEIESKLETKTDKTTAAAFF